MTKKTVQLWVGAAAVVAVLAVGSAVAATPQPPANKDVAGGGPAVAIPLRASLSASQVGTLQVASTATGRFLGALVRAGFGARGERLNLSWSLVWAIGVQNTTGPVTGVEIRSGDVSATAGGTVFLKLCGPCSGTAATAAGASGTTLVGGAIRNLTHEQLTTLRTGNLYVNVMTAANPAGELRGQITRRSPVTTGAPPNNRIPNPIKPGTPGKVTIP